MRGTHETKSIDGKSALKSPRRNLSWMLPVLFWLVATTPTRAADFAPIVKAALSNLRILPRIASAESAEAGLLAKVVLASEQRTAALAHWKPSLPSEGSHFTSRVNSAQIHESGVLNGLHGIWVVRSEAVSELTPWSKLVAGLPNEPLEEIRIRLAPTCCSDPTPQPFKAPPHFGWFSSSRRAAGVVNAPPGCYDLETQTYRRGEIMVKPGEFRPTTTLEELNYAVHKVVLDYGVDTGVYGALGLGLYDLYEFSQDGQNKPVARLDLPTPSVSSCRR